MFLLTILIIVFAGLSSFTIADDPCRFGDPSNGIIDLSSVSTIDGTPAYRDKLPKNGSNYSTFILYCLIIYYF